MNAMLPVVAGLLLAAGSGAGARAQTQAHAPSARMDKAFEAWDTDHNGVLSRTEFDAGWRAVVEVGIGQRAQVPGVAIAGKTGTAQIESDEGMRNVAWFLAFAPIERPQIAIAVALEGDRPGEEFAGAEHAAPVVREIIAAYVDKK